MAFIGEHVRFKTENLQKIANNAFPRMRGHEKSDAYSTKAIYNVVMACVPGPRVEMNSKRMQLDDSREIVIFYCSYSAYHSGGTI